MVAEDVWNLMPKWHELPTRQQGVMLCLARGLSNMEIANELGISLSTVRNNIADVYEQLGFSNRVQALLWILSHEELAADIMASV